MILTEWVILTEFEVNKDLHSEKCRHHFGPHGIKSITITTIALTILTIISQSSSQSLSSPSSSPLWARGRCGGARQFSVMAQMASYAQCALFKTSVWTKTNLVFLKRGHLGVTVAMHIPISELLQYSNWIDSDLLKVE